MGRDLHTSAHAVGHPLRMQFRCVIDLSWLFCILSVNSHIPTGNAPPPPLGVAVMVGKWENFLIFVMFYIFKQALTLLGCLVEGGGLLDAFAIHQTLNVVVYGCAGDFGCLLNFFYSEAFSDNNGRQNVALISGQFIPYFV